MKLSTIRVVGSPSACTCNSLKIFSRNSRNVMFGLMM
jgi:hypothetical protein